MHNHKIISLWLSVCMRLSAPWPHEWAIPSLELLLLLNVVCSLSDEGGINDITAAGVVLAEAKKGKRDGLKIVL